jgi:tetratricopeptide (TPR) repeat protein
LVALQRYEEALESYEQVIELAPDNADAWTGQGLILGQLGRIPEAIAALTNALKLNPQQSLAQTALQRIALQQQQQQPPQQQPPQQQQP